MKNFRIVIRGSGELMEVVRETAVLKLSLIPDVRPVGYLDFPQGVIIWVTSKNDSARDQVMTAMRSFAHRDPVQGVPSVQAIPHLRSATRGVLFNPMMEPAFAAD